MSDVFDQLFSPSALDALDQRIALAVKQQLADTVVPRRRWGTVDEAARVYGCTANAIRHRVRCGYLQAERQGSRLYVDLSGAA